MTDAIYTTPLQMSSQNIEEGAILEWESINFGPAAVTIRVRTWLPINGSSEKEGE